MLETLDDIDLQKFVAALNGDYEPLSARIRQLLHSVKCDCEGVTLRLHFPTIVQGKATVWELINVILDYMTPFATHRRQIIELEAEYGKISPRQYRVRCERLKQEANNVFIKAQKAANKNGEAGELLLFILTEWVLKAPQLLAKLPLKSARNVPVHGTDGIHVAYWPDKQTLCTYWGEAKLHSDVGRALADAVKSIKRAITSDKQEFELSLVRRNIDTVGLDPKTKALMLSFLNPYGGENYNRRVNATTCLIGFDFDAYKTLPITGGDKEFSALAAQELIKLAPRVSASLMRSGIRNQYIELFLFPVPSVAHLRDEFQKRIGWNK